MAFVALMIAAGNPAAAATAQGGPTGGALTAPAGWHPSAAQKTREASKNLRVSAAMSKRAAVTSALPAGKFLGLIVQKQSTSYYCVPASGRAILSAWLASTNMPSQDQVARSMGTTSSGTNMSNADFGINSFLTVGYYVSTTSTTSSSLLWSRATTDINNDSAPLMLRMLFGSMPWRSIPGNTTGHAVVNRGFDQISGQHLDFWDPWDSTYHTATLSTSWSSLNTGGRWMVW